MKLNHDVEVLGFTGEPMVYKSHVNDEGRPLKIMDLLVTTLYYADPPDAPLGADTKARIFQLMGKCFDGTSEVDLTVEELALLKKRAGLALDPFPYGRLCQWLEGMLQRPGQADGNDVGGET